MATPPPTIIHEVLPSTPAKEWAEKTTASLTPESGINSTSQPDNGVIEHVQHAALTPGPQLPGAYPGDPGESGSFPAEDAKNAAIGVLRTAKQYIPTQQDVEKAMLSASETAKQYLPNAVASYFPSSPNNNTKDQEMIEPGVVDCLPREDDESGVANLPNKGNDRKSLPPAPHFPNGIARTPMTNVDSSRTSTSIATDLSTQAQAGSDTATPMPSSTPSNSIRPSSDTFPGDTEKTDLTSTSQDALVSDNVLKLSDTVPVVNAGQEDSNISKEDDQLAQQPILNTKHRAHPLVRQGATSRGGPLSEYAESLENETNAGGSTNLKDETLPIKNDTTTRTPSNIQPAIVPNVHSGPEQPDTSHLVHKRDGSINSNTSASSCTGPAPSSGSPQRSRFLDKVKGEMKVISGKLAHNEEKVEEGRRLMGKTV